MRLVRFLPQRLQHVAPEAIAFAAIGLGNLVLYFLIFNALIFIGAVKATIIATLVTTYLAYLANRHWTYKDRPRRAMRREYTLFFAVNMVGLLMQSAGTGLLKYGFGMSERQDRLAFNITTTVCICAATLFRFWTYRTFVFKDEPATTKVVAPEPAPAIAPAEGMPVPVPGHRPPVEADESARLAQILDT
ncbi:GtrA family protein [Planosporangium mesophilum]|uniref:GtrA family protein n=1 Tax=Planosporangium mesophilum TaxID=689768 RepID=UPI00197B7BEF